MTEFAHQISVWLHAHSGTITTLIAAAIAGLGILSAFEAILKARTAQGAVAWAIVLIGFPPLFVPLYWIFGRRKFRGYAVSKRGDKRDDSNAIHTIADQLARSFAHFPAQESERENRLIALSHLATLPFSSDNQLTLLINGKVAFAEMFRQIENARKYILMEFYILRDDDIGKRLAALLERKAAEGVQIHFIYDEIGSIKLGGDYIDKLRRGGVHIHAFNSTKGAGNRFQINFRNHRKILICDGEYGLIGGMNIGNEYCDKHPVLSPWRDTGLSIVGPAVQAVQLAFLEDWYWACESLPELNWQPRPAPQDGKNCLILASGPADSVESCALMFLNLINHARDRLWIVSPYFVPDAPIIQALQLSAMRGVDVRILLPKNPDRLSIKLSSYTAIRETLPHGVQFYYYREGFLHQKILLVDDDIAAVGTANLDNRSFRLNFEITALCHNPAFASEVEAMLLKDFERSKQLLQREVENWSLLRRLVSRCVYLFAPLQ
jgi:cardiolipin synthase A/B